MSAMPQAEAQDVRHSYRDARPLPRASRIQYEPQPFFLDGSPYYLEKTDTIESPSLLARCAGGIASSIILRSVGFALHFLLICIHIAFMVVQYKGLERRVVMPLGAGTDRISVILPVVTQTVWASCLAVLLLLTQELALRKIFTTDQLLTATHDGLSAWSGVGSALLGLLRQFSLRASFTGVFCIAVYLVAAHVLHITAPSLLTLVATNTTTTGGASVSNALPSVYPLGADSYSASAGAAAGLLPVLGKSEVLSTPGLDGNILYDVPIQQSTTGLVAVGLTTVDVQCGSLPNATQIGRKSDLSWTIGTNHSGSAFMFDVGLNQTEADKYTQPNSLYMGLSLYDNPAHQFSNGSVYWPGSGSAVRPVDFSFPVSSPDAVAYQFYGANIVFWTFVNVTDASNANGSYVPLSPAFPLNFVVKSGASTLGQGIQVIGCTISTSQGNGTLDAASQQLLSRPERRNSSVWKPWAPALYDDNKPNFALPTLEETLGMVMTGPLRDKGAIPEYLTAQSGLPLTTFDASYAIAQQPTLVPLHKFENALANATAAILWTAARIGGADKNALFHLEQSVAGTMEVVPALRLNINKAPLIAGLVASCVLFLIFWLVTPLRSSGGDVISGGGLLQILWHFADSPAQKRVAKVSDGEVSLDSLRQAGMFRVLASGTKGADGTVRRRATVVGDDDYERVGTREI